MDNSNNNKLSNKHKDLIKIRQAKLNEMRKEREKLQIEKLKRENSAHEKLEEISLKRENREKIKQINDSEIEKIHCEIIKSNEKTITSETVVSKPQTNRKENKSVQKLNLKCYNLPITEISPVEAVFQTKQTQTDISRLFIPINVTQSNELEYDDLEYQDVVTPLRLHRSFSSNLPPGILSPGLPIVMDIPPALTPIDKESPWNYLKEKTKKTLEKQKEELLLSEEFQKSLKRAGLAMEKVISKNKNIYIDYISGVNDDKDINDSKASFGLKQVLYNKDLTENRCITCIDWSPYYSDQIAAAYFKNESSLENGADVIIWNRNISDQTPEHIFHCYSSIMSLCFAKFNPNLLIGATYSGQIVLWDKRVKTSIPVQNTRLNYKAHTQPIYCLREIGDDSSNNIISISSDGKLCSWSIDMLALPLDVMQLQLDISEKVKKPISVNCMDFPANGRNNLIFGGEDGCAYLAFRNGYESGVDKCYEKHEAPVTGISSHYNQASPDFGDLFLTSSIDSSIKLWSLENTQPLHTIKNDYDYIMDIAWSPVHPAVFLAGDGKGQLDLYNLNENIDEPIKSINIKDIGINRISWNSSGQNVAIGTVNGELHFYNVAENLANPTDDEWGIFYNTLEDIRI